MSNHLRSGFIPSFPTSLSSFPVLYAFYLAETKTSLWESQKNPVSNGSRVSLAHFFPVVEMNYFNKRSLKEGLFMVNLDSVKLAESTNHHIPILLSTKHYNCSDSSYIDS